MTIPIADYERERQAFKDLVQPGSQFRILLFHGVSGCGKTTLITACLRELPADIPYVPIEFRESVVGVTEIFSRVGNHVGWKEMSSFVQQISALQRTPVVKVKHNLQVGSGNQINAVLNVEDPLDRDERRVSLTEAWFADLMELSHPLLLVLDTFEKATTEVRQWLEGPFLARAARVNHLRVLLAGQDVPDRNNIEWGRYCSSMVLSGVPDPNHWLPVIQAMNRRVPYVDPLPWLHGICSALNGRPNAIMNFIEGLQVELPA